MSDVSHLSGVTQEPLLTGSILLLVQFDICDEIQVSDLSENLKISNTPQSNISSYTSAYGRYESPPLIEPFIADIFSDGVDLSGEVKYYSYGVLSVLIRIPFAGSWEELTKEVTRWMWNVDLVRHAQRIVNQKIEHFTNFLVRPYSRYLSEEYIVIHLRRISGFCESPQVLAQYGQHIAQLVRGDSGELSPGEIDEVLRSQISYYRSDLAVIGWNAAFLYDKTAEAAEAIHLLEYANSQLLEFRYYDELLTSELTEVYRHLERGRGVFAHWRLARSATRLQTALIEVLELTERSDNAIKFLSDMFAARLYKLAAAKIGASDYRDIVVSKIHAAKDLNQFLVDRFNQSRAFFLELTVVIILVIELIFLLLGKRS